MEQTAKCKSLKTIYQGDKLILDGPYILEFDTIGDQQFHIKIEQNGARIIEITSDKDVSVSELYDTLTHIEKFLMLLDGVFIPLSALMLSGSDTVDENVLVSCQNDLVKGRLSYFSSAGFGNYCVDKLLKFDIILTAELFCKWEQLLDELNIVHQIYLYFLSDNKIAADVKCSFLIELAEPLIEIVKEHTEFFSSLTPGAGNTTLKKCLDALIRRYGVDIFNSELSNNYRRFLSVMVNSRVRIMHIKRKQKKMFFNGSESILYIGKMSLLYRKIMFEILGINETNYKDSLEKNVLEWDKREGVLKDFLLKLSQ